MNILIPYQIYFMSGHLGGELVDFFLPQYF